MDRLSHPADAAYMLSGKHGGNMSERIRFFYHEKGNHDETWHYLFVGDSGELHVETEYSAGPGRGSGEIPEPTRHSIEEFLAGGEGTAQRNLRDLLAERGNREA